MKADHTANNAAGRAPGLQLMKEVAKTLWIDTLRQVQQTSVPIRSACIKPFRDGTIDRRRCASNEERGQYFARRGASNQCEWLRLLNLRACAGIFRKVVHVRRWRVFNQRGPVLLDPGHPQRSSVSGSVSRIPSVVPAILGCLFTGCDDQLFYQMPLFIQVQDTRSTATSGNA